MGALIATANRVREMYWPLIKSRQTFLLTFTGVAGYLCQAHAVLPWGQLLSLVGSLLITISGCTVLNMLFDQDIDRKMARTRSRPLAAGLVSSRSTLIFGAILVGAGLAWSAGLSALYFIIVLAGAGLNVLVYTLWLKRRSAWSILWGGVAGGMPILAGHTLSTGRVDGLGLLLALAVLLWIPSHNLTLGMLHSLDYLSAGVPTFLNRYGEPTTRWMVFISSLLTVLVLGWVEWQLSMPGFLAVVMGTASLGLVGLALAAWLKPSARITSIQYQYSSLYMLASMLALALSPLY